MNSHFDLEEKDLDSNLTENNDTKVGQKQTHV